MCRKGPHCRWVNAKETVTKIQIALAISYAIKDIRPRAFPAVQAMASFATITVPIDLKTTFFMLAVWRMTCFPLEFAREAAILMMIVWAT